MLDFFFFFNQYPTLTTKRFLVRPVLSLSPKIRLTRYRRGELRKPAAEGSPGSSGAPGSSPRLLTAGASGRGALCGSEDEVQTPPLLSAPSASLSVGFSNSRPV